jgi:NAD(P)-dependent dehydrogenase (short-subunit alcohol dehydrogenase family)
MTARQVSAKHGVLGLVKTLALEGADDGITAVAVCPGYVRTPLVERQISDRAKAHGLPEDRVLEEVILARTRSSGWSSPRMSPERWPTSSGPAGAP